MRRLAALAAAALLAACASTPPATDPSGTQLLITVVEPATARYQGAPARFGYLPTYGSSAKVTRVLDALSRDYALRRVEGWRIDALGVYCEVFATSARDTDALLDRLARDARVESVQKMQRFRTLGNADSDPYRKVQNGLDAHDIDAAHRLATGKGVRVAVIDTWIDTRHPDLRGRIRAQTLLTPRAGGPKSAHGTAVAGVIAALADNGEGIAGVAPQADLYSLAACWREDDAHAVCSSFTLARALDLALAARPHVINLSLAGPRDRLLERLLAHALERGTVVVGALESGQPDRFPAAVAGVIAVSAGDSGGAALAAPGHEVLTTVPGARYDFVPGSSIAAAHVSGIAALALQTRPALDHAGFTAALGTLPDGRLSACATLQSLRPAHRCEATGRGEALKNPPSR